MVVRQALLDYGTTVGITALSSHIHDISIADVNTTLRVPVVGAVALSIKDITCLHFTEPRELAKLQISNGSFYASSKSLSAKFKYKWSWESQSLPLNGAGGVLPKAHATQPVINPCAFPLLTWLRQSSGRSTHCISATYTVLSCVLNIIQRFLVNV